MEDTKKIRFICHTADWHIRTYRYHDEYKKVFENLINDISELVKGYDREEVRVAICGDLVHNKITISNEQLLLTTWLLRKLEEIAPLIIIPGNHDLILNNKDRLDSITPIVEFLPDKEIKYFKESKCYLDNNIVWCVYSIIEDNTRPDIESARKEYGDDKTYIGLFHSPIIGCKTDIGYEFDHGAGLDIFEGCDIVMCGDIHLRQKLTHKGTPIVQVGSLLQQGFGERINSHGFLLWDIETKTFTEHDVENESPFYHFKITSIDDLENGNEKIINL